MDLSQEEVPVVCSLKTDIDNEIRTLYNGPPSLVLSHVHIVDRAGLRVVLLGTMGLMGGGTDNNDEEITSESQLDTLKWLVGEGVSMDHADNDGRTPLFAAAYNGQLDTVKWLVRKGASMDHVDNYGRTSLFHAAYNGQLDTVKWLVRKGASVDHADNDGRTPLFAAASNGQLDTVKWLVGEGASMDHADNGGRTSLFHVAYNGQLDTLKWLVRKGASMDHADNDGWTPLFFAASNGQLDTVKWLVGEGASMDQADNDGWTPLFFAASNGQLDTVKWLVGEGASMDQADNYGRTPLFFAAFNGQLDRVKWLVGEGASMDQADNCGRTPLFDAASNGQLDRVKWLVGEGASMDQADKYGRTPLFAAASNGQLDTVKWLVGEGASMDQADKRRETVLSISVQKAHVNIVWFLLLKGASIIKAVNLSMMPHVFSLFNDHFDTFKWLLSKSYCQFQNRILAKKSSLEIQGLAPMAYLDRVSPILTLPNGEVFSFVFIMTAIHQIDEWSFPVDLVKQPKISNKDLPPVHFEKRLDIYDLFPADLNIYKVLVIGIPGVGKTSLVRKLSFDWSKGRWGDQFAIIFLLPLQFLLIEQSPSATNKEPTLASAIAELLGHFSQMSTFERLEAFVEEKLTMSSTLVILDGLEAAERDPTGNIQAVVQQAKTGQHKLLMLTRPDNVVHHAQGADFVVELSSFDGQSLAKMMVKDRESKQKAKDCIEKQKFIVNSANELCKAVAELVAKGSQDAVKSILKTVDAGDKDLFGWQNLVLRTKLLDQWMRKSHSASIKVFEKQFPVLDPLASWLKRGLNDVRRGNQLVDDTLLKSITGLLQDVPSIVPHAKLQLLSQVLTEVEEQRWNIDPSVADSLVQIVDTDEEHQEPWQKCMKKGLQNIVGETRKATMQCIGLLGQLSTKLAPQLIDLLLTICTRDRDRDRTMIDLLRRAPECVVDNFEELVEVSKSNDSRVQRAMFEAIPEIAKNAPRHIARLASKLLEACVHEPKTVSTGVLDILGICAEENRSLVDDVVTTLLRGREEMNEEQCIAMARTFVRVVRATPDKAIDIVNTLLDDDGESSRPSSFRLVQTILPILSEISQQQADSVMDLVRRTHQANEANTQTLALMLEAIRYVVKRLTQSLPELILTVRNASKHMDSNVRRLAFEATAAIAEHRPDELDEDLIEAVMMGCKNEKTLELRLSALEAASELPPAEMKSREFLSGCFDALTDGNAEIRQLGGKIIAKVASENTQEQDHTLGNLLQSYRNGTDDMKQGIVHCLRLLIQDVPETILAVQSVLVDAAGSPTTGLASEAVSALCTVASSHEQGSVNILLSSLSKACEREEHEICFLAIDALTSFIRRESKHREWLLNSLKKLPEPQNNREWLVYLQALEAISEVSWEDVQEFLHTLLMDWSDKHAHVRKARKEIIDRMSLSRLLWWFEASKSDLVAFLISRRLMQTPTVLSKDSLCLRVYYDEGIATYKISTALLTKLKKMAQSDVQSDSRAVRRLFEAPWKRFQRDTTTMGTIGKFREDKPRRSLTEHCRAIMVQMLVHGSRDSEERKLITNDPTNDLGKIAQNCLKVDLSGINIGDLGQMASQPDLLSVVVDGGVMVCDSLGDVDFLRNIPRHFTERFLSSSLLEDKSQRASEPAEETRLIKYAIALSILTEEVGREKMREYPSLVPAIEGSTICQESSLNREAAPSPKEDPARTVSASLEKPQQNNLFAGRFMLEDSSSEDRTKFAYDQHSKMDVVLKFYDSRKTFENTKAIYDDLDPEYICRKVCEIEEPGFPPCLVFERAQHSLEHCLNNRHWANVTKKPCLHQILMSLDHLKKRDIVHCDVKPSNILFFSSTHSWKLANLDRARSASEEDPISYSSEYVAPEVLLAEEKGLTKIVLDPSTDMWSFGIIAFEVLSGKRFYGRNVSMTRVKEYLCDRTRPLPSLEYVEESQMKRLIENSLIFEPHMRWSTKTALNVTFRPAEGSEHNATPGQVGLVQVTQTVAGVASQVCFMDSKIDQIRGEVKEVHEEVREVHETVDNTREEIRQVHEAVNDVRDITLSSLQEIESANLMTNVVVEELRKPDSDLSFELREGEAALMIKDDFLNDPLFVLRLNDAYRIRISLRHENRSLEGADMIRDIFVELPDRVQRLEMKPSESSPEGPEVVALLRPGELDFESMLHRSKSIGKSEEKYAQLKIVVALGNEKATTGAMRLRGTVYCKMVRKWNPLLVQKGIKSVAELWKNCPQWIRTGARGAVILAKFAVAGVGAATVGDPTGAVMVVECVKRAREMI